MSLGITLSQLIVERPKPISSGIGCLDNALGGARGGFEPNSIYEIFGPPGIGKTKLGIQVLKTELRKDEKCLWIETHKCMPANLVGDTGEKLNRIRITKFSQLVFFFQELKEPYPLIVIDGLSQILNDYLHVRSIHSTTRANDSLHSAKVKSLITLLTTITKYTHSMKSTVIMLNDTMNTSFQEHADDTIVPVNEESHFLVRSHRRKNVQVLKSGLVANIGVGGKDSRWEVFIKSRIGLFWDWDRSYLRKNRRYPEKNRIAVVFNLNRRDEADENAIVRIVVSNETGDFVSYDTVEDEDKNDKNDENNENNENNENDDDDDDDDDAALLHDIVERDRVQSSMSTTTLVEETDIINQNDGLFSTLSFHEEQPSAKRPRTTDVEDDL